MTEIREVPMAEFSEWSQMMTRERGVVRVKLTHRPECPTNRPGAIEAFNESLKEVGKGKSFVEVLAECEFVCDCETVIVEIS